jgi:hypothetical protein
MGQYEEKEQEAWASFCLLALLLLFLFTLSDHQ